MDRFAKGMDIAKAIFDVFRAGAGIARDRKSTRVFTATRDSRAKFIHDEAGKRGQRCIPLKIHPVRP